MFHMLIEDHIKKIYEKLNGRLNMTQMELLEIKNIYLE